MSALDATKLAHRASLASAFAAVAVTITRCASAEPDGLGYELRTLAVLNPAGVRVDADAAYRTALYRAESPLLAYNGWTVRAGAGISPAAFSPFASISLQPFSTLEVSARYEADGHFGTIGFVRSYPSPTADYGRDVISSPAAGPEGSTGAYALWVQKLTLGASAQALVGRLLARSAWAFLRTEAHLASGDRVIYDPTLDTVVYAHGWAIKGDSDVGYALSHDLDTAVLVGARFTYVEPLYPAAAFAPGEAQENPNGPSMRLGPWVRWPLLTPDRAGAVSAIDLTTIAQFYLADRFHTGRTTSSLLPMLGLVLSASGGI
jgi:hypothetical protein